MRDKPADKRARARRFGLTGESLAALWLRAKGYRILARAYAMRGGEIDIVAARFGVIAFVEVKARPTLEAAMSAITPEKRRRLSRAARHWLARHPRHAGKILRGDAVYIAPGRLPSHRPGAVELALD
jgi:putative endonuclease